MHWLCLVCIAMIVVARAGVHKRGRSERVYIVTRTSVIPGKILGVNIFRMFKNACFYTMLRVRIRAMIDQSMHSLHGQRTTGMPLIFSYNPKILPALRAHVHVVTRTYSYPFYVLLSRVNCYLLFLAHLVTIFSYIPHSGLHHDSCILYST